MNSILRSTSFRVFRKGLLLFGMVFFVALVPSLIGRPLEGVTGEPAIADVGRAGYANATLARVNAPSAAPLQSGGTFEIKPSVIAGGGGTSTNGTMQLDGTIGQSVLGASSGGTFSVLGGFWQAAQQQPQANVTISGTILFCAAGSPPGAANTTLNLTGDTVTSTSTGGAPSTGAYSFTNLVPGSYVVTPTKTGAVNGINANDATRVLQHIAATVLLNTCQQRAADTSENGVINANDVTRILNFVASNPPLATDHTGEWRFCRTGFGFPAPCASSTTYVSIVADQTSQDYSAFLLGEVSGNWSPAGPETKITSAPVSAPSRQIVTTSTESPTLTEPITVTLPTASVLATTNFTLPITIGDTTPSGGKQVTGFNLRFTYNPAVVGLQATPFSNAGTLSSGMLIVPNATTPGVLILAGSQAAAITGSGVLVNINFTRVGGQGTSSALTWQLAELDDGPNDGTVNSNPVNGNLILGPTAVRLSSCDAIGYDAGVYLNWKTGFETDNLGFNIYREIAGKRTKVNPDVIAGSALMVGTSLQAGQAYGWWDKTGASEQAGSTYWVEEIDLNGIRTMHGPFGVRHLGGRPPRESQAELLSQVGRSERAVRQLPLTYELSRVDSAHPNVSTLSAAGKLSAMPALKMTVREEGWYRVTRPELISAGYDTNIDPRNLQLYLDGVEQPMRVAGEQDGRLDAIEFFGSGQDTASTDAHVYWLVSGDGPGSRIGLVKGEAKSGGVKSFPYTVERRDRTVYFSSLRNGDADNFFGQVVTSTPVDQVVTLRHLDSTSSDQSEIEVALQGVTDQGAAHSVSVLVNGAQVGKLVFSGQSHKSQKFSISRELLKEGDNIVTFAAETAGADVSLVDYIRVTYPHSYAADHDSLRMTVASGSQTIEGFSDGTVRVFDITNPSAPVELAGKIAYQGGSYLASLEMASQGTRTLLALTDSRIKTPASIALNEASKWKGKKNKADLLIITRSEFFSALEPLKALRESQGMRVQMVDVSDIYDEFSDGEKTPQAVKDFLSNAASIWKRGPQFVLFAGHASLDPRNHLGFGDSDLVPTKLIDTGLMETASDDWFVDFNNDGLPELAVGRLPFRTQNEATTMVSKILSYENSRPATEALLVADANDGFDFESASGQVRDILPTSLKINRIDRGRLDAASAKTALIDAINRGQKIVNYMGHGSVNQWKGDLLTNDDAGAMINGDHLSLFVMMTCLNGYFQDASLDSLAESLLKAERGGAVAVWASSGMTGADEQAYINQELYRLLFAAGVGKDQTPTLGEAVMRAKAATLDPDVRRTWLLLGDPSMRIK